MRQALRGQSTLEYAMFTAVVAAALATMQVYVRRSIQANLKAVEDQINAEALPEDQLQQTSSGSASGTGGQGSTGNTGAPNTGVIVIEGPALN